MTFWLFFLTFRRQTAYLIVGKFCEFCEKITTKNSLNSQNSPTEKKQSRSPNSLNSPTEKRSRAIGRHWMSSFLVVGPAGVVMRRR